MVCKAPIIPTSRSGTGCNRSFAVKLKYPKTVTVFAILGLALFLLVGSDPVRRFPILEPSLVSIVEQIKGQSNTGPHSLRRISPEITHEFLAVLSETTSNGCLIVEAHTDTSFPLKHRGFSYVSMGQLPADERYLKRWRVFFPVSSNWFYFSD